jgi:cyclic beta-1,2-glucan synthetase
MTESWLPRQALICRIYARTGFYQNGGAWGFRDQLQDSLAALWFKPAVTKRQILRCAAVQFEQGDVLHWWYRLPHMLKGVRTHCSDDLVWLPYVTAEYIDFTGDLGILDTKTSWLTGEPLLPHEKDRYFEPGTSDQKASLYEHCVCALDHASTHGEHGLPLIGSCDWNDGFSEIGILGRGESVWLAMFLSMVLDGFAPLCENRKDKQRADHYRSLATAYREAADTCFVNDHYLRAYFDDGSPLGVTGDSACAVDSLAQSFSALSGLPAEHTKISLDTALRHLVDREHGVIRLLAPSFAHSQEERHVGEETRPVGYITAYPPGLRENGGQYTHASVWLAIAFLKAGCAEKGIELLKLLNTAQKYADGLGSTYRGEPYALAGDVYSHPDCPGRAGWTHYTGSAGWYYTAVLRYVLGLHPHGDWLEIRPNLPDDWNGYEAELSINNTSLSIRVKRGEPSLQLDGYPVPHIPLDGSNHAVLLTIPS